MGRRAQIRPRPAAAFLLAGCALLLASPAVRADWKQIPAPGGIGSLVVADASTWLKQGSTGLEVTRDAGGAWNPVSFPGFDSVRVAGAVADRTFRVVAWLNLPSGGAEMQVFRVAEDGAKEPLGPIVEGKPPGFEGPAVSDDGATWIPFMSESSGSFKLAVIFADGSSTLATLSDTSVTSGWKARRTVFGMRLLRYVPTEGSERFARKTFRLGGEGEPVAAEAYPVELVEGNLQLSPEFGRASWDGGAHWSRGPARLVPRSPGLGMPRYMVVGAGGIAERYSPPLFRATSLPWPDGAPANYVVDAGSDLVAWSSTAVYVHDTADLPKFPTSIGPLRPKAQAMLARAAQFRADAGLPPLTGDALVSQAARNHSAYSALHPEDMVKLSAHFETPGKAGFTGFFPGDRCAAVGTACSSEVMFSDGETDPVGGWLATIYHRPLVGSPTAGVVGAGQVPGGWAVMDGKEPVNVLVKPIGYPSGRWRGEEGFEGEIPDPVDACNLDGQPIAYPLGIAVSLYTPAPDGSVSRIEVRKEGSSAVLPGCLQEHVDSADNAIGSFVLDDPLVPGQAYSVHAVWNPGPDSDLAGNQFPAADLSHDWGFYFHSDSPGEGSGAPSSIRSCRELGVRRIKSIAKVRRDRRRHAVAGIEGKVVLRRNAQVRLRQARLIYRKASRRRSVRLRLGKLSRRTIRVGRTSFLRFRLPRSVARRMKPGKRAALRLTFAGRRISGCRRFTQISRTIRVRIGWVRVVGPVAWTSRTGYKHGRRQQVSASIRPSGLTRPRAHRRSPPR